MTSNPKTIGVLAVHSPCRVLGYSLPNPYRQHNGKVIIYPLSSDPSFPFREAIVLRKLPAEDLMDEDHGPLTAFIKLVIESIKSAKRMSLAYGIRLW